MLENGERPPDHLFKGGVTKQAMTFIVDNKNKITNGMLIIACGITFFIGRATNPCSEVLVGPPMTNHTL